MPQDIAYAFAASVRKALFGAGAEAPTLSSVTKDADPTKPLNMAVTRTYYIQAEQREWVRPLHKRPCAAPKWGILRPFLSEILRHAFHIWLENSAVQHAVALSAYLPAVSAVTLPIRTRWPTSPSSP